jgi:hypothetical protein
MYKLRRIRKTTTIMKAATAIADHVLKSVSVIAVPQKYI